jgi:hypothetical protein
MGIAGVAAAANNSSRVPLMIQQVAADHVGICAMVENPQKPSRTGQNVFSPVAIARGYLNKFEHQIVAGVSNVTIVQEPAHGTLEDLGTLAYDQNGNVTGDTGERNYYYHPESGYAGQDSLSLLVEMGGNRVKITYFLHVFGHVISDDTPLTEKLCPNGQYLWVISKKTSG